ncbi:tRNA lysidine(34) synthetase TilS [Blattabacterium cuenoti]|uniref:tRNA lysidine(34) synthetase TilS n=1 Tax=Blattabacterium cuenoti TaxID=1653831 RepID=UPI00163BD8A9|nr:tRNA lysidine(34) synthetase TilS [Blattabacterium cuenoti]
MNKFSYEKYDHFFLKKIMKYFSGKKKVCVAVSGGLDSMVLLNLLLHIPNLTLGVAHCNFTLRDKESNKDEDFVRNFCLKKHIMCHIKRFNTLDFSKKHKLSIQMAARKLRYDWFNELFNLYELIALGHHLNDSIETFFLNLIRGTGIKGLLGIPVKREKFIRPLSNFTKEEILHYAKIENINWRLDKSNFDNNKYLRNKIRSVISIFSDPFYKGVKKSINLLYQENLLIENKIKEINQKITIEKKYNPFFYWKLSCSKILELQPLSCYLFKLFFPYGFSNMKNLENLLYAQSGKQLISKKYRIIKNENNWILISKSFLFKNKKKVFSIQNINKKISFPINVEFFFITETEIEKFNPTISSLSLIDFYKIQFPLKLRTWRNGDYFYPINMKGKKKLSKYYKEKKFSLLEKEQIWLLVNGNEDIILVIGNRLDDRFKVTKKTNKILGIKIIY